MNLVRCAQRHPYFFLKPNVGMVTCVELMLNYAADVSPTPSSPQSNAILSVRTDTVQQRVNNIPFHDVD
jgi:hypothetical protein